MVNDIFRISWELVVIIMVALVDAGESNIDYFLTTEEEAKNSLMKDVRSPCQVKL